MSKYRHHSPRMHKERLGDIHSRAYRMIEWDKRLSRKYPTEVQGTDGVHYLTLKEIAEAVERGDAIIVNRKGGN